MQAHPGDRATGDRDDDLDGDLLTAQDRARLYPRVTSFRSRRGTLTPAQTRNWDRLWPTMGRDVGTAEDSGEPIDPADWFGRSAPVVLEIGSGTGTATAAMAQAEPEIDVIAVEVYRPGIAQLLGLIDRADLHNVRVIRGDAVVVLRELLAPASLDGIRVFFPDPWPKARHHKRRLIQPGTLALMADVLTDDGGLHIATDHADYAEWIAEMLADQDVLVPVADESGEVDAERIGFSLSRPTTKFEGRAADEGRSVTEFVYRRRPRASIGADSGGRP